MAPNKDLDWRAAACARPLSFHHVTQVQIQELYRVDTVNPYNVLHKKYPDYTNFENVYSQLTYSDDTMEKGQQITGGVSVMQYSSTDPQYCRKMCRENKRCMAWSLNKRTKICSLRDMVGKMTPEGNSTSGIMGSHYVCNQTPAPVRPKEDIEKL
jgi:hypothetical protein